MESFTRMIDECVIYDPQILNSCGAIRGEKEQSCWSLSNCIQELSSPSLILPIVPPDNLPRDAFALISNPSAMDLLSDSYAGPHLI